MREKLENNQYISLTPSIALDYLIFKKEYEGDDFLSIWHNIIGNGFDEQELCHEINVLRARRIDFSTKSGQKAFDNAFDEIFRSKIQHNKRLDKSEFKSLVGTLMHAVKKTKKLTMNFTKRMTDVLNEKLQEKEANQKKKQERIEKREKKEQDILYKEIENLNMESGVNPEFNAIFSELKTNKENQKPVGEILEREELEMIFDEAWKQFLETEPKISKKRLNEIHNNLYTNNVY